VREPACEPALPLSHPALLAAALVAALCVAFSVTWWMRDTDLWQHLLVGRTIWATHAVPRVNLWTWPAWGAPDVNYAWGFEALAWPFWRLGGVAGLFAWRWATTLLAFALLWMAARRMGARDFAPLVVLAWCALVYRQRSEVRPETLVAVLLALEIWILETWRNRPPPRRGILDPVFALPLVLLAWGNVHLTAPLGLALPAFHLLAAHLGPRRSEAGARPARRRLWLASLAALAACLANPFGPRVLTQSFEYLTAWRHELIYRSIVELRPVSWAANLRNGLPVLVAGWPLLILARWRARRFDLVEALACAAFTTLGLSTHRFLGLYALAAAPYVARDLSDVARGRRWPAWTRSPARRALLTAASCVAIGLPEWSLPSPRPGVGVDLTTVPVAACDFMQASGVRGRGFSPFEYGGYLLWRFWPDRGRLPFLDIHQTGSREDRRLYAKAFLGRSGWRSLDSRHRFDYVLLPREHDPGTRLLEDLDQDSTFAPVFVDDVAALFVRRAGPLAALAGSAAYRVLPASHEGVDRVMDAALADSALRARVEAEIARRIAGSRWNASASMAAAWFAALEGRGGEARRHLERAIEVAPRLGGAHFRLATLAAAEGRVAEARREYRRELALDPGNPLVRDSLAALDTRAPR
jgi:hypothetical protein